MFTHKQGAFNNWNIGSKCNRQLFGLIISPNLLCSRLHKGTAAPVKYTQHVLVYTLTSPCLNTDKSLFTH